jgi:hypothetical protein
MASAKFSVARTALAAFAHAPPPSSVTNAQMSSPLSRSRKMHVMRDTALSTVTNQMIGCYLSDFLATMNAATQPPECFRLAMYYSSGTISSLG